MILMPYAYFIYKVLYNKYINNPMLSFSSEDITFQYSNNSHLTHKLSVKNTSLLPVYFKVPIQGCSSKLTGLDIIW